MQKVQLDLVGECKMTGLKDCWEVGVQLRTWKYGCSLLLTAQEERLRETSLHPLLSLLVGETGVG